MKFLFFTYAAIAEICQDVKGSKYCFDELQENWIKFSESYVQLIKFLHNKLNQNLNVSDLLTSYRKLRILAQRFSKSSKFATDNNKIQPASLWRFGADGRIFRTMDSSK